MELARVAAAHCGHGGGGFLRRLTFHQHELTARRTALARNVVLVAGSQPMPSVDALKNFDAIQRMSQPRADEELLALLQ